MILGDFNARVGIIYSTVFSVKNNSQVENLSP